MNGGAWEQGTEGARAAMQGAKPLTRLLGLSSSTRPNNGPGPWTAPLALMVEVGVFVWMAAVIGLPWVVALTAAAIVTGVLGFELTMASRGVRRNRPWPQVRALLAALALDFATATILTLLLFVVLA